MLDRNGSVKPSTLLECDRAKSRADTLVEVLKVCFMLISDSHCNYNVK